MKTFFIWLFFISLFFLHSCTQDPLSSEPIGTVDKENSTEVDDLNNLQAKNLTKGQIDSLMNLLVTRVEDMANSMDDDDMGGIINPVFEADFISISNSFGGAIKGGDSLVPDVNVGYIVSTALALNTSKKLQKLMDSIADYVDQMDERKSSNDRKKLYRSTLRKHGITGLSKVLLADLPRHQMFPRTGKQFPRFITLHYIQDMAEFDIIPILNNISRAVNNLKKAGDFSVYVTIEGDRYEIDKSDIYFLDGAVHLLRGTLYMFTVYDCDLYTSASDQSYSWVEQLVQADYLSQTIVDLNNSVLSIKEVTDQTEASSIAADVLHYNMGRPGFLSIRRQNHQNAYDNIKAVPAILKDGLRLLKAETDNQNDDLIPNTGLLQDIEEEMLDIKGDLIDEGFSVQFASHFGTPESFLDFINLVLTQPYTINENIDGHSINITVDISKFFTNPIQDLRTILPKHALTKEVMETGFGDSNSNGGGGYPTYTFRLYDYEVQGNLVMNIPSSKIKSVVQMNGYTEYTLHEPYQYREYEYTSKVIIPIQLTDDNGTVIPYDTIDELIEKGEFLPYFGDYTFNGIFPGMTRTKWLNLIYQ